MEPSASALSTDAPASRRFLDSEEACHYVRVIVTRIEREGGGVRGDACALSTHTSSNEFRRLGGLTGCRERSDGSAKTAMSVSCTCARLLLFVRREREL